MGSKHTKSSATSDPPSTPPFPDPIPGVIPHGALVQFVGPPKCGKTAMLASWLVRFRDTRTICGLPTHRPASIGIITTDHKWRLNQGIWLERVGYPEIRHVALRDDPLVKWATLKGRGNGAQDLLKRSLDTLQPERGGLVVLDVAGPFIAPKLNDYNEVLAGIGSMGQVFDTFHVTALLLGHMGKQKADPNDRYLRPHERILGSGALIGFTDTTIYMLGPEDTGQPYHTLGWLPTHAPMGDFKFHQNSVTGLFEPFTGKLEPEEELSPLLLTIMDALPLPPATIKSSQLKAVIMATCDVEERKAWALINDLVLAKRIVRTMYGYYMRVQEGPCTVQ